MSLPILIIVGLVVWFVWTKSPGSRARPQVMPAAEARRLLEVPAGADAQTIADAHRRLIARVHPDAGGSAELARRVNAARDVLLAETHGAS